MSKKLSQPPINIFEKRNNEKETDQNKEPILAIMVGTPCYSGLLHQDYVRAIIDYPKTGIPMAFMHIGNESLITRGRNTIISFYYANKDNFSHLLFLDADVYLSAEDLVKLVTYKQDVVAAAVPMKGFTEDGHPAYNVTGIVNENVPGFPTLVEVDRVGTAAFMLSNKAVEALVEDAKKNNRVYQGNPLTRGDKVDCDHYDIFQTGIVDGVYLSEDFWVCNKLKELGFKVYVDKTIQTLHSGTFTFGG